MFHGRLFHAEEPTKHFEQELLRSLLIQDLGCLQHRVPFYVAIPMCIHAKARLMGSSCEFALQDSLSITIQLLSALINHVCGGAKSLPVSFDSVEWVRAEHAFSINSDGMMLTVVLCTYRLWHACSIGCWCCASLFAPQF